MYGRIFESLYRGSMVGAGAVAFAVWGYVISHMEPDDVVGAQVDLNPKLLAPIIGEEERAIEEAIEKFCQPDPMSTSKDEEGRRLVRIGQFAYRVVTGRKYMEIRSREDRREYNRLKKQEERQRKNPAQKRVEVRDRPLEGSQRVEFSKRLDELRKLLKDTKLEDPRNYQPEDRRNRKKWGEELQQIAELLALDRQLVMEQYKWNGGQTQKEDNEHKTD